MRDDQGKRWNEGGNIYVWEDSRCERNRSTPGIEPYIHTHTHTHSQVSYEDEVKKHISTRIHISFPLCFEGSGSKAIETFSILSGVLRSSHQSAATEDHLLFQTMYNALIIPNTHGRIQLSRSNSRNRRYVSIIIPSVKVDTLYIIKKQARREILLECSDFMVSPHIIKAH